MPAAGRAARAGLRRVTRRVVALNLGYFAVEFAFALRAGSVSLFADSVDFLEDASVGLLVLLALGWAARRRAAMGRVLAGLLLVPAAATLWTAWGRLAALQPWLWRPGGASAWPAHGAAVASGPAPATVIAVGAGALAVNLACAAMLARQRNAGGSLTRAAFLSARNDALANVATVAAGALTAAWPSAWPDLAVGLGIAALNADAAREVWAAAGAERKQG